MKKNRLSLILSTLALAGGLVSCQANEKVSKAKPISSFLQGSRLEAGSQTVYAVSQLNLFDKDIYQLIQTQVIYGYSMNLGTTSIISYGNYIKGSEEGGVAQYTLKIASEVILNSFSKAGGYHISINTTSDKQTYPVEMPAEAEGEKLMANSKDDIITKYGVGGVVYTTKNEFSVVDPNADSDFVPTKVEEKSTDVSAILTNKVVSTNLTSVIAAGSYGDGSQNVDFYQLNQLADGSYDYINTQVIYGYSMIMGTKSVTSHGKVTKGSQEDGVTALTLNKADAASLTAYSKAGGYNITINTEFENQTYPVEMLAEAEGEKPMANSKNDVIAKYGLEKIVYTYDANNELALTNPNQ